MDVELNLQSIGLDIEAAKQAMAASMENMTDISDRILDEKVTATKLETAEYTSLKDEVKRMYLIDLSESTAITEAWIDGLKNMILCTSLNQFDEKEANKGRFEEDLPDLIPDAALSLKIKSLGENKVVFIGYMDSCQAYSLLGNYVGAVKNAKLYLDNNGFLKEVKSSNIEGVRVHV